MVAWRHGPDVIGRRGRNFSQSQETAPNVQGAQRRVMLPDVADVVRALESRARKSLSSQDVGSVLELMVPKLRDGTQLDRQALLDDRLWEIVSGITTPYLTRKQGGHGHSQEEIACLLAVYARLDVASAAGHHAPVASVTGALRSGSTPAAEARLKTLLAYSPAHAEWSDVREAMAAALGVTAPAVDNKWVRLAPLVLAAELVRFEALRQASSSKPPEISPLLTDTIRELEEHGLLPWLVATPPDTEITALRTALELPLVQYADAGHDFGVVVAQLATTYHSMHGLATADDHDPRYSGSGGSSSEDLFERYFERQLDALDQGVNIDRVFLYRDDPESEKRLLEERARKQLARASGRPGTYTARIGRRELAETYLPEISNSSLVILDYDHATRRVVKMITGDDPQMHNYEITADRAQVARVHREFGRIMDNCTIKIDQ